MICFSIMVGKSFLLRDRESAFRLEFLSYGVFFGGF